MRILTPILILAVLAAAGWAYLFGPYWIDYYRMNDVAGSAVLSWAAFDETRGRLELAEQLRFREIPDYLPSDRCSFYKDPGEIMVVDCKWTVDVYLPGLDQTRRLAFQIKKSAGRDGRLLE